MTLAIAAVGLLGTLWFLVLSLFKIQESFVLTILTFVVLAVFLFQTTSGRFPQGLISNGAVICFYLAVCTYFTLCQLQHIEEEKKTESHETGSVFE